MPNNALAFLSPFLQGTWLSQKINFLRRVELLDTSEYCSESFWIHIPVNTGPLSKIATRIRACAIFSIQNPHQKCAHVRILVVTLGQWT